MSNFFLLLFLVAGSKCMSEEPNEEAPRCSPERLAWLNNEEEIFRCRQECCFASQYCSELRAQLSTCEHMQAVRVFD